VRKILPKLLVAVLIVLFFVGYQYFDLGSYLSLDYLKAKQGDFQQYYEQNRALTLAVYTLVYVAACALSFPGATILTLAGGAFFGLGLGLVVVSFASTVGATLAFLASRFLLRDSVEKKLGERLAAINEGVRKEGAFYLFTLRLVPIFPFFVINLVMGLTPIRTFTYFWVSQLGMLPGTAVYVNAGTQLAKIDSLKGIVSPKVLLSFVLLGLFPIIAKKGLDLLKARRALAKWPRPKRYDYNLVVIGAGSGGLVSAYIAAAVKAKVLLIEKKAMGGDCLNTGCVPSKALIRSAKVLSLARRAKEFGFRSGGFEFDFAEVMQRVQRVIKTIEPHDSVERYEGLGVECVQGEARILSPYEVEVNGKRVTTRNIVVATGGGPLVPKIDGLEGSGFLTSDTIWNLRTLPRRLLVLGGGPIGCELAQSFQRFGSQVTLVDLAPSILSREDKEVADIVTERFRHEGIKVITQAKAKRFVKDQAGKAAICDTPAGELRIDFDEVLLALGRKAHARGFGLEELGVRLEGNGTIEHDELMRTNIPNIYCVGDVAGPYQFTHVAAHQAWYAAVNALFSPFKTFKADYRVIPRVTFTDPEVATVGLSEREAKEKNIPYELTTYGIDDLDRAIAEEEAHGFVKVLTVPGKDKILGATVVGEHAGDVFIEFVAAMRHGFGLNKILGTIHPYPTLAEANKYAAGVWKKAHAPQGLLRIVERFHAWRRG
jgi:pyruvate/2-oxoglutarate dehydrogenase complex dihydrolipoamide dehydrogenase (E3) component/uncharacterized membrane protein YdjX (TVP38/TMEM64 family)